LTFSDRDDYVDRPPPRWQFWLDALLEDDSGMILITLLVVGACCCASPFAVWVGGIGAMFCQSPEARANAWILLVASTLETLLLLAASAPYLFR
jgi:hypothetical protein